VEMAKQLASEGKSCLEHLAQLSDSYGLFLSSNSYVKSSDAALTRRLFERQRGGLGQRSYCKEIGRFQVTGIRDLTTGYDSRTSDGRPELPLNVGGEMITYYFADVELGAVVTLRTSGTEPKIKWYSEMRSAGDRRQACGALLEELVLAVVRQLLDPVGNGLEVRPEDHALLTAA
ncbi:unnamed protein product, partial [Polarella glacialis]